MATSASAKIYQFPARGKYAQTYRDLDALSSGKALARVVGVASDAWYHEAAMREEEAERRS